MIKRKLKICKECQNETYIFSKKRCKSCAMKSYSQPKQISSKQQKKKKEQSSERDVYFKFHIERCTHSEESGKPIYNPTRASICHLIDKGRHKSLQANLDNYLYLLPEEHSLFDGYLFKNEFEKLEEKFPNAWSIAKERYRKLIPLCQENTRFIRKLSEYLGL